MIGDNTMNSTSKFVDVVSEKNCNSVVIKCNELFVEYAGVKSEDKILGNTDCDFPWSEYADIYRAHELDVMSGKIYSIIFPLKNYSGEKLLFLHNKIPKFNEDGLICGVVCHAIGLINFDLDKLFQGLSKISLGKRTCAYGAELSKKQEEVLFYLIRGKSAKSIAKIMGISFRTVEDYIQIIKDKLRCNTKNELIDFAISNGCLENINHQKNLSDIIEKLKTS